MTKLFKYLKQSWVAIFTILILLNNKVISFKENIYAYINICCCLMTVITLVNIITVCLG